MEELVVGFVVYVVVVFMVLYVGDWCFVLKGVDLFGILSMIVRLVRFLVYVLGVMNMDFGDVWCC